MDLEESICACEAVYSVEVVTEITKENLIRGVVVRGAQVPRTLLGVEAVCRLFSGCTEVRQPIERNFCFWLMRI